MSPANRRNVPIALGRRVRQWARHRCGYYLCSETLLGMPMEFDHLIPRRNRGCPPLVGERRLVVSQRLTLCLQLAHDERDLFLTGSIERKLCWQWARSVHRAPSCHTTGSLRCG